MEAGRWWLPKQFKDGMVEGTYAVGHDAEKFWGMCHACNICPDRPNELYMGYFGGGAIILDISDPTRPKLISQLMVQPPFAGKFDGAQCHTYMRLTGRNFAVLTNEGERFPFFTKDKILNGVHKGAQPMNNLHMIDVSDPADPTLVAEFPYPEVPADFPYPNFNDCGIGAPGPFGPHNIHEPMGKPWLQDNPNLVYCCYFHAGMRVFDVSRPLLHQGAGLLHPPQPGEAALPGPRPRPHDRHHRGLRGGRPRLHLHGHLARRHVHPASGPAREREVNPLSIPTGSAPRRSLFFVPDVLPDAGRRVPRGRSRKDKPPAGPLPYAWGGLRCARRRSFSSASLSS